MNYDIYNCYLESRTCIMQIETCNTYTTRNSFWRPCINWMMPCSGCYKHASILFTFLSIWCASIFKFNYRVNTYVCHRNNTRKLELLLCCADMILKLLMDSLIPFWSKFSVSFLKIEYIILRYTFICSPKLRNVVF